MPCSTSIIGAESSGKCNQNYPFFSQILPASRRRVGLGDLEPLRRFVLAQVDGKSVTKPPAITAMHPICLCEMAGGHFTMKPCSRCFAILRRRAPVGICPVRNG